MEADVNNTKPVESYKHRIQIRGESNVNEQELLINRIAEATAKELSLDAAFSRILVGNLSDKKLNEIMQSVTPQMLASELAKRITNSINFRMNNGFNPLQTTYKLLIQEATDKAAQLLAEQIAAEVETV